MANNDGIGVNPDEMDEIAQALSSIMNKLEEAISYCKVIRETDFYREGNARKTMEEDLIKAHEKIYELQTHYTILCSHVELVNKEIQNMDNSLAKSIEAARVR